MGPVAPIGDRATSPRVSLREQVGGVQLGLLGRTVDVHNVQKKPPSLAKIAEKNRPARVRREAPRFGLLDASGSESFAPKRLPRRWPAGGLFICSPAPSCELAFPRACART